MLRCIELRGSPTGIEFLLLLFRLRLFIMLPVDRVLHEQ